MKIILDNIIYSHVKQGGVSNYWYELSKHLLLTDNEVFFYEGLNAELNFHRKLLQLPSKLIIKDKNQYLLSFSERLAKVNINENQPFLFHSSYYRSLPKNSIGKEVTTVHDFTHNFYSSILKKRVHNYLKFKSIKNASGIICISNNTYKDLLKFCPPQKNQKVAIIHNGVSKDFYKISDDDSKATTTLKFKKNDYILFVGGRQNYKNFDFVIDLIKETSIRLIVVGSKLSDAEKNKFGNSIDNVEVQTNVDNFKLNILYNNALALLYPSSYEGFGIPVIEAMKAGCPIIGLNKSSIPEISGSAALLLDDLNISKTKDFLKRLELASERAQIIENGLEQANKFSWEKCCSETASFYKEIY